MPGRSAAVEPMILITGDNYKCTYTWKPGGVLTPFPATYQLYFEFENGAGLVWTGGDKWQFTISGSTASLVVQSEVADLIPDRMPYRLRLIDTGVTPNDKTVYLVGNVKRQEPKP